MEEVKDYIKAATLNVKEDRAATKTLLMSLMKYINLTDDRHKEVGLVAAKYLETLQRSNEQLVKLAALMQKGSTGHEGITEDDKNELFDIIQERANDDG
jgi:hypothetical protein